MKAVKEEKESAFSAGCSFWMGGLPFLGLKSEGMARKTRAVPGVGGEKVGARDVSSMKALRKGRRVKVRVLATHRRGGRTYSWQGSKVRGKGGGCHQLSFLARKASPVPVG